MISILVAGAVALAVTLLGTPVAIRVFRVWGWGQRIREDGPHTHLEKVGTPTMGGIVMLLALIVAYLATRPTIAAGITFSPAGLSLILAAVGFGLVGFIDDYLKIRRQRSLGLSKAQKFIGTALVSMLFALVVVAFAGDTGTSTSLSFVRPTALVLGVFFFVWVFVVLTSSSNAVNLTDGLDGLAAGSSILVLAGYVFIAFWQFRHTCNLELPAEALKACYKGVDVLAMQDTAIIAAAMMGAAMGFLWWNAAPAKIFMGDTGALTLGGLFGGMAITTNTQMLLIILGGLYVIETMSVIVQVISFRGFGRRVFRMSPIHHHFELAGLAGVHRDRPLLDHRRPVRRGRSRRLLRGLHRSGWTRLSDRFAQERVVVVGAGVAGVSAARVLAAEGARVLVTEARPAAEVPAAAGLEAHGVEVRTGGHDPHHFDDATLVLVGPGVPPDAEVVRWIRDRGLPLWGEMELGARLARGPYLAVTGTNGKTTVTSMTSPVCGQAASTRSRAATSACPSPRRRCRTATCWWWRCRASSWRSRSRSIRRSPSC